MKSETFSIKVNHKIKPFHKIIEVDSDKSLSIRSFLIGSICQNISTVTNVLESEDVLSTIQACRKLGVKIVKSKKGNYKIFGKGLGSFFAKKNTNLNFGNSGTLARLLLALLATTPNIDVKVRGDNSLNKRNMRKLIELMSEFGATFMPKKKYHFPLRMISSEMPIGIKYVAGVSAQLKSAVILAGLNSFGSTEIIENLKSRDHTERMLAKNYQSIKITGNKKKIIKVLGRKYLNNINVKVPGDPSTAAFMTALTLLNKKSHLKIKNVGLNNTRVGFYKLLKKQGANIKFKNIKIINNEPRGDIFVKSCNLKSIRASKDYYVNSTDEYPILFAMAALIKGTSVFNGIGDLVNKESNRIKEMQLVLKQIGVKSKSNKNSLKIFGKGMINANKRRIMVPGLGDHRICMSSFVLSILTGAKTNIKNFETVYTSSPSFLKIMKKLGAKFEIQR